MVRTRTLGVLGMLLLAVQASAVDQVMVPFGATWKYLDNGSNQGTAWRAVAFNDAPWASGPAQLGYGDGDEATVVSYGPNANNKYITTYFRHTFTIADLTTVKGWLVETKRDDGIAIYVNGTEVFRNNMTTNTIAYNTRSSYGVGGLDEGRSYEQLINAAPFVVGSNTIAVEIHQDLPTSSDLSFDLRLTALDADAVVFRGPYPQSAGSTAVTIKWKTDVQTNARVRYGTSVANLDQSTDDVTLSTDHEVRINGLSPATKYWYSVGTSTMDLVGTNDTSFYFNTYPVTSTPVPLRVWVTGDQGTGYINQFNVRDAYLSHVGSQPATAWLMLGDNAYFQGREAEYQMSIFKEGYPTILRNTCVWPAPGNHDYYSSASAANETGAYYSCFDLPKLGECGGVPSNKEAYYSFDHGNVHFISLDSYDSPRSPTGAMANWLVQDLLYAKANSDWIIAYWHHPPYTKGSHNSDDVNDSGGLMRDMRENILPILEANGVDLVLTGHSHSYERSFLIDSHYGLSTTFAPSTMLKDGTSGRADEAGAYDKPAEFTAHAGAVYTVCGVSGKKDASGALDHPTMYMSTIAHCGSMILDVDGNDLHARFLNEFGAVVDHFDLHKEQGSVRLALKVKLEGPYDNATTIMHDSLRMLGHIPFVQPYTGIYTHAGDGGTEETTAAVLTTSGADAIVDWIFIELRSAIDPTAVVATHSALLQRDGDVVAADGSSALAFRVPMGNYHVAVRHRNHLGTMTMQPYFLRHAPVVIDLTNPATATFGTEAQRNENGTMLLWMGNTVVDTELKYVGTANDRDPVLVAVGGVLPTNTVSGYLPEDTNMDGTVKYVGTKNDRDPILVNVGGVLPTNTRLEQLP